MEVWVIKSYNKEDNSAFVDGVFSSKETAIAYVDMVMQGLPEVQERNYSEYEIDIFFKDDTYYIGRYKIDDTPMLKLFEEANFI